MQYVVKVAIDVPLLEIESDTLETCQDMNKILTGHFSLFTRRNAAMCGGGSWTGPDGIVRLYSLVTKLENQIRKASGVSNLWHVQDSRLSSIHLYKK